MKEQILFWTAAGTFSIWLISSVEHWLGNGSIGFLRDSAPLDSGSAPRVSVVVAARNEALTIEPALRSVLSQHYPNMEVVVVDDRSDDGTDAILDRIRREASELRSLRIESLPPGWLGKNHALQRGAETASGHWILFTDADVVMHPLTLARAVGYAERRQLDHLAIPPSFTMNSPVLDLFGGVFALLFVQYAKPWKARDPRSWRHVGIGAFNLVRAKAYRSVGGHERIRLRPDDDMKLGKLLKMGGFRQDVLLGTDMVSVEWYPTVREAVRGLEKNAFAGVEYSVTRVAAATLGLLALGVWPFLAVPLTSGPTRLLYSGTVTLMLLLYLGGAEASGSRRWLAPLMPLGILLFVYTVLRSTALALHRGGIYWRDTFYSLSELRENRL